MIHPEGAVMTVPVTVSERDLRALLGIVTDDRDDLPEAGLPPSLLNDLMGQVRCDVSNFNGQDSHRQAFWFGQQIPVGADGDEDERAFWEHYLDCNVCSYPDRSGDLRSVTKASDFYSAR